MSLPFLDHKQIATGIMSKAGTAHVADEIEMPEGDPALKQAAVEVLGAIERKSAVDLARALKALFQICDSEPHKEGPHEESDSAEYGDIGDERQGA